MYLINYMAEMAVIARPKLNLLGEHWGVQLSGGRVAHLTEEQGVQIVTFEEFAKGKQVRKIRTVPPPLHWQTVERVSQELARPQKYDAIKNNCETFANRVTGEKPESKQVAGWFVVALMGALFWSMNAS
jgi:hypothetical protein